MNKTFFFFSKNLSSGYNFIQWMVLTAFEQLDLDEVDWRSLLLLNVDMYLYQYSYRLTQ